VIKILYNLYWHDLKIYKFYLDDLCDNGGCMRAYLLVSCQRA